jgi:DNA-binding beta-propeller fold protein YncE
MRCVRRVLTVLVITLILLPGLAREVNAADRMYWTDAAERAIKRANLDGSGVTILVDTGAAPQSIALDVAGGKMYWVEADGQKIRRANLDGSVVEDLVASVGPAGIGLDVAGGKMYWTDVFVTGWIQRANLNGTAVENLNTVVGDRESIALDLAAGKMYWTNRGWQSIERANLDGSGVEFVVSAGLNDPRGIALDLASRRMYWTEVGSHKIRRANLDGSGVQDIVTGLGHPSGIALDPNNGKMYWTDFGAHKIQRANLDGSGIQDLVAGLSIPVGIALELGPGVIAVSVDIKPGSFPNHINLGSAGVVPVAILSSETLDATQVDPASVTLAGAAVRLIGKGSQYSCGQEDVNNDGRLDLFCHVETAEMVIELGDSVAILEAQTNTGQRIRGEDSISIVP